MRYGTFILALGALWSSQASAGKSVYVAPGGIYIGSAQVYVRPENADPAYAAPGRTYYAPGYVPRGPAYAPGYVPPGQVSTEPPHILNRPDQSTRRSRPMLIDSRTTGPLIMKKNLYRGRLPRCRTVVNVA